MKKVTYIPCPVCGEKMNRRNFAGASGVVVDLCKDHGTWFDKGEIRQCIEFVLSGGLQKAARLELEREKERINHLESMARSYQSTPSPAGGSGSMGGPYVSMEQDLSENFLLTLLNTLFEVLR